MKIQNIGGIHTDPSFNSQLFSFLLKNTIFVILFCYLVKTQYTDALGRVFMYLY